MIPDRSNKKTWPAVTWSLMMTGQLMVVPTRVCTRMAKSASVGEAELHTGILMWCRPGKSFRQGVVIEIVTIELVFGFCKFVFKFCNGHLLECLNHTGEGDQLFQFDLFLDLFNDSITNKINRTELSGS